LDPKELDEPYGLITVPSNETAEAWGSLDRCGGFLLAHSMRLQILA
jgi:hypothetical protein